MYVIRLHGTAVHREHGYPSLAQPYTLSFVAEWTANLASNNTVFGSSTGYPPNVWSFFGSAGNKMRMATTGSSYSNETATDNVLHSFQQIYNGTSSSDMVDATTNTGLSLGTTGLANNVYLGASSSSGGPLTGLIMELGIWSSALSTGNQSSLENNQHSYWGF